MATKTNINMNKKLLTLGWMLLIGISAFAQYPLKTIQEVQMRSPQDLANGNDESTYSLTGDTIRIRGVVIMDGGISTIVGGKQVWIQTNDGTPFSGIDVYQDFPSAGTTGDAGTGILSLQAGDSVEITGVVLEFQGETEFVPINTNPATPIQLLGGGIDVKSTLVNASDLNDPNRNNIITTGEQWEGMYVELQNMTVSSVDFFSNGARVSFNIVDAQGNKVNVSDRFMALKLPASGGTFVPPTVGDKLTSVKGVLLHSKNNRGYELQPFKSEDIVYGAAAPSISGISRSAIVPTSSEAVTITATITDKDGVDTATLYYAVGAHNMNYQAVPMTANGNIYTATIPAQAEGSLIKYFLEATDVSVDALVSRIPNVPNEDPFFYVVKNSGLSIYDVQYTPFSIGNSGYVDMQVTLTGVVTASSADLGYVFIQQENALNWGGIMCVGSSALATLTLGDKVTVTGTVKENFGFTRLENITAVQKIGTGTIDPIVLHPDSFRTYSYTANEPYEGMLVKFAPTGQGLYIVDQNADDPSEFAEYRVGLDTTDAAAGCRVLAGRVSSSSYSSLNVSYVNDSMWIPNPGIPQVIVQVGDTMTSLTGIMVYTFSNMKLLPRNNADFENFSNPAVGISSSFVNKGNVVAYPNPAQNKISFDYILPAQTRGVSVVICDLFGKVLKTEKGNDVSGTIQINTDDLAVGTYIYMLRSVNEGMMSTGRFVIVK